MLRTGSNITGRYDLIVHVVVRDMQQLKDLAFDHFTCHSAATRIETFIVYDSLQQDNLLNDYATDGDGSSG